MKYLLDTNILVYSKKTNSPFYDSISQKLFSLANRDKIYISLLSIYEMEYGFHNAPKDKKKSIRKHIRRISNDYTKLPLKESGAKHFGRLKKAFKDKKKIGKKDMKEHNIDIMLASVAIVEKCVLVSNDAIFKDFAEFEPKFKFENWTN